VRWLDVSSSHVRDRACFSDAVWPSVRPERSFCRTGCSWRCCSGWSTPRSPACRG